MGNKSKLLLDCKWFLYDIFDIYRTSPAVYYVTILVAGIITMATSTLAYRTLYPLSNFSFQMGHYYRIPGIVLRQNHMDEYRSLLDKESQRQHMIMNLSALNTVLKDVGCVSGHIYGWCPMCEPTGCLRTLRRTPRRVEEEDTRRSPILEARMTQFIESVDQKGKPYWRYGTQIRLLTFVTNMQWNLGVYGSVGVLGLTYGLYSTSLVLSVDSDIGERYFSIGKLRSRRTMQGFLTNMAQWNFTKELVRDKKIRIWQHDLAVVSKGLFHYWGMSSARLVRMDFSSSPELVIEDMVRVACILREGGILVFDVGDPDNEDGVIITGIKKFLQLYGHSIFAPLIALDAKIYLTTALLYHDYMAYIERHIIPKMPWRTFFKVIGDYMGNGDYSNNNATKPFYISAGSNTADAFWSWTLLIE